LQSATRFSPRSLLFLIYINDIGNSISGINIKLFADDKNLFIFNESDDVRKIDAEHKKSFLALGL